MISLHQAREHTFFTNNADLTDLNPLGLLKYCNSKNPSHFWVVTLCVYIQLKSVSFLQEFGFSHSRATKKPKRTYQWRRKTYKWHREATTCGFWNQFSLSGAILVMPIQTTKNRPTRISLFLSCLLTLTLSSLVAPSNWFRLHFFTRTPPFLFDNISLSWNNFFGFVLICS